MKEFRSLVFGVIALATSAASFGQDLTLPGEKWIASHKGFVCDDSGESVAAPQAFAEISLEFERVTTDRTLDNALIKASFIENGSVCRYSAILFADNAAETIELVESKAYSVDGQSECAYGAKLLDDALAYNDYLYYGHPHNLAIMTKVSGASEVCANELVGINFVVSGRVRN